MGARLYDAVTARFMTPDPTVQVPGWTQSWNRFSYAWNSPMNWVDPTGLQNVRDVTDDQGNRTVTFPEDTLTGDAPPGPTSSERPSDAIVAEVPRPVPASQIPGLTGTGVSPVESPAPLTASPTPGAAAPDVRTPAATPGAGAGDEFLPAEWEDPPVPNQGFAPKLENSFSRPEFQVRDSSEMWETAIAIVTLPGAPELGIGKAAAGLLGRGVASAIKAISLPAWRKVTLNLPHILARHIPGAPFSAGRTVFPSTMSAKGIERAIRAAYETSTKVGVQGKDRILLQGQGSGLTIEMWFNKATKTIETAYPVTP